MKPQLRFYLHHRYPHGMHNAHRYRTPNRRNQHRASRPGASLLNTPALPAQGSSKNPFPGIAPSLPPDRTGSPSHHAENSRIGHSVLRLQRLTMCNTGGCLKRVALETMGGTILRSLLQIRGAGLRHTMRLRSLKAIGLVVDRTGEDYLTKAKARNHLHAQNSGHLLACHLVQLTILSASVLQVHPERLGSRLARRYREERMSPRRELLLDQIGRKISPTGEVHLHQGIRRKTRQSRIISLSADVSGYMTVSRIGLLRPQSQPLAC